jgi:uncharacterized YigZ family protein
MIKTVKDVSEGVYKNLNSKFIAYAMPFENINLLNGILEKLKKEHPKAVHFCYAYRCGFSDEWVRSNDDGEPSGSAGKPILNQLYSFEVQNVLVVVVRYYGGTKLGVAGLIQAYKESTREALENAKYIEVFPKKKIEETLDMETYYLKIEWIKKNQYEIVYQEFLEENVILHYLVEI